MRRDQHRDRALAAIEQQRRRGQPLAAGAQHVGRADIARSDRAQIARAGQPRQQHAERDRAEQIAGQQRQQRRRPTDLDVADICVPLVARIIATRSAPRNNRPAINTAARQPRDCVRRTATPPTCARAMADDRARSCSSIPASAACRCSRRRARCCRTRRSSMPPTMPASPTAPRREARDRRARAGAARPAGRALSPAAGRDRLQHRLDDRARRRARRARPAGRRHGARDQARRARSRAPASIGVLGTEATVRQPYVDDLVRANSPPTARCCATARPRLVRARRGASCAARRPIRRDYRRRSLAGLLDQPGGDRIDTVVLACTHFPLVADELAAAAPRPIALRRRRRRASRAASRI